MNYKNLDYVIYGTVNETEKILMQLNCLEIAVKAIVVNDEVRSYKGNNDISRFSKNQIIKFAADKNTCIILSANNFGVFRAEICELCWEVRACFIREIELFSHIVKASWNSNSCLINPIYSYDVMIGTQVGFVMGGLETWATNLFHQLKSDGKRIAMIEPKQYSQYKYIGAANYGISDNCVISVGPFELFTDYIDTTLKLFCTRSPHIFVDNGSYRLLAAAWIAKKKLGVKMKVVSVVHNKADISINRISIFKDIIDHIIVVSEEMHRIFCDQFPDMTDRITCEIQTPRPCKTICRCLSNEPIRLAYVSRLEPENKRSLWVMDVINYLVSANIRFELDIAGVGVCSTQIEKYISDNNYGEFVHYCGYIPYGRIFEFWKRHQIFMNFSVAEGGPLTLLESMSQGVVPVVTRAGICPQLIHNGKNGFLINNPKDVAEIISILSKNRDLLDRVRNTSRETIQILFDDNQKRHSEIF